MKKPFSWLLVLGIACSFDLAERSCAWITTPATRRAGLQTQELVCRMPTMLPTRMRGVQRDTMYAGLPATPSLLHRHPRSCSSLRMAVTDGEQRVAYKRETWVTGRPRPRVDAMDKSEQALLGNSAEMLREKGLAAADGSINRRSAPDYKIPSKSGGHAGDRQDAQIEEPKHSSGSDDARAYFVEVIYDGYVCIRAEPNLFSSEIGVVEQGDVVHVCKRATIGGLTWLKLKRWTEWDGKRWKKHDEAWICEIVSGVQLVQKKEKWHPFESIRERLWKILSICDVTVRSSPSTSAPILGFKKSKEMVEVAEAKGEWIRLAQRSSNGDEQWISIRSQTTTQTYLAAPLRDSDSSTTDDWEVVWAGGVSVRAGPSFKSPIVDGATHGDVVQAEGTVGKAFFTHPYFRRMFVSVRKPLSLYSLVCADQTHAQKTSITRIQSENILTYIRIYDTVDGQ
jgi:hypothetical protein